MPWFKVDDGFPAHPKLERLASEYPPAVFAAAVCVWTLMGADCMARLTDGRFSFDRVIKVVPISPRMIRRALDALTSIGLPARSTIGQTGNARRRRFSGIATP